MINRARVVIEGRGGVAEVTRNEGEVEVVIVDHDNGDVLPGDDAPDPRDDPGGYIAATICCPDCGESLRDGVKVINEMRTKQTYNPTTNDWGAATDASDPETIEVRCLSCGEILPIADEIDLHRMIVTLEG
jgi:hypothetical protein